MKKIIILFLSSFIITACSSAPTQKSLKEDLTIGARQGKVQGMEIEFVFTDSHVKVNL